MNGRDFRDFVDKEIKETVGGQFNSSLKVGKFFADWMNGSSNPGAIGNFIGKDMRRQHPTLQGMFFNLLIAILKVLGDQEYFDARNEQVVKTCQAITKLLEDQDGIGYQPLI